jgi:hypothetical protein
MNIRQIRFTTRRQALRIRRLNLSKRQKLVTGVLISSFGLFVSEYFLGRGGILMIFFLAFLTDAILYFALYKDLEDNFNWQVFILPFLFTLAFGLFYLLVPARLLTRIVMTSLYGVGLYSLFLAQNIFTVSAIRTIALLTSARTVSFTISLLSYFFLTNVVFSLHLNIFLTLLLILAYTLPMVAQSLWTYSLDSNFKSDLLWLSSITAVCLEVALILWFWPSTPTLLALFLTGIFYTVVGLSQAWFEKRLFRGVLFEYFWVSVVIFGVLILFTFLG